MESNDPPTYKRLTKFDRKTLEDSVKRYRAYAELPRNRLAEISLSPKACGLCLRYHPEFTVRRDLSYCGGCPVSYFTGMAGCIGTPYSSVGHDRKQVSLDTKLYRARRGGQLAPLRARLIEEADFLQSLIDNAPAKP